MRSQFTCLLTFLHYWQITSGATLDLYAKSVKGTFNDKYQSNGVFKLKTTRDKPTGLITFSCYLLQPLSKIYYDAELFYRYGTIYRQYLINSVGVEVCEFFKTGPDSNWRYNNPLGTFFRGVVNNCCKTIANGCPYLAGWYNMTIDINATVVSLLPAVFPAGHYKITYRLYDADNTTINFLEGTSYIKPNHANRAGDFSMLNMG